LGMVVVGLEETEGGKRWREKGRGDKGGLV
jgi:hypothetical protein